MKKIPTLFERVFKNHKIVGITDNVMPGCDRALTGELIPTEKMDGSCCAIIDGELYKRYDAKKGKTPPAGAIPCDDPDPVTGHWPHWVKCERKNKADQWFIEAYENTLYSLGGVENGTYEAIGPHFQGNPYGIAFDIISPHGVKKLEHLTGPQTLESLRQYLTHNCIEGIVWWDGQGPVCKLKRTDFGLEWPVKGAKRNDK